MIKRAQGIFSGQGLRLLALAGLIYLSIMAYRDTAQFPAESRIWHLIAYGIAFFLLLAVVIFAFALFGSKFSRMQQGLFSLPHILRAGLAAILLVAPALFLVYTEWGAYFTGKFMRLEILLLSGLLATLLLGRPGKNWLGYFLLTLGGSAYLFYIISQLGSVQTTPFSLGWSEGNRFYDYSLSFAKNLYQYSGEDLRVPYFSPGRYALWGALFLIPGLPIWAHRLWNALLWAGTPLLLSWLLFRTVKDGLTRRIAILWGALFINQGPVYPHLLVPMLLFTPFLRTRRLWLKLLAGALFSYYAGISRFTWAVLPGTWLVLYDLLEDLPRRSGTWVQKLWKPALLGIAGMLPGILGSWFYVITPEQDFVTSQPLLLYRLWPNATYGQGIVIGALLISLAVIIFTGWMVAGRRWQVHPLAVTAVAVALAGFLAAGLAASTKIGGGSNLHNLDMFILTLVFLTSLVLTREGMVWQAFSVQLPRWLLAVIVIGVLLPGWSAYQGGAPVEKVPWAKVEKTLATIRQAVDEAKSRGEVLFLDQRQLLTFGYIRDVQLVPDYEKKYMMDQAMGENAAYFAGFEKDLKAHRFSLIISDIQKISYQDQDRAFSEENNAYVRWVSKLLLKYYEPVYSQKDTGVMLLEPKP